MTSDSSQQKGDLEEEVNTSHDSTRQEKQEATRSSKVPSESSSAPFSVITQNRTSNSDTNNPFNIIFASPNSTPEKSEYISEEESKRHSQAYLDIETQIHSNHVSPQKGLENVVSNFNPIITIVDQPVSRSGSIVSRSATLKNRHRIINRNKMIRAKDLRNTLASTTGYRKHEPGTYSRSTHPNYSNTTKNIYLDDDDEMSESRGACGILCNQGNNDDILKAYSNVDNSRLKSKKKAKPIHTYFSFPIKRKTSLKRKPVTRYKSLSKSIPNFKNIKDLDNYLNKCFDGNHLTLGEVLPQVVDYYDIESFIKYEPKLKIKPTALKSTNLAKLEFLPYPIEELVQKNQERASKLGNQQKNEQKDSRSKKSNKKLEISAPIQGTFTKNGYNPCTGDMADPTKLGAAAGAVAKTEDLFNAAEDVHLINKSKSSSYPNPENYRFPSYKPPTTTPYSSYREKMFEAKLTRPKPYSEFFPDSTISRKKVIQMNRTFPLEILLRRTVAAKIAYRLKNSSKRLSTHELETYSDSSSDGSFSNSYSDLPRLSKSDSSESDSDTIDINDLIKNDGSLLSSDLLPSPQISYSTDIFAKIEKYGFPELDCSSPKSEISVPYMFTSQNFNFKGTEDFPSTNPGINNQFVSKLREFYLSSNTRKPDITPPDETFDLKPMNRSKETLDSSESNYQTTDPYSHSHKSSYSTNETSAGGRDWSKVIAPYGTNDQLDDIAGEISNIMNSEVKNDSSFILPKILLDHNTSSSPQTMYHNLKSDDHIQVSTNTNLSRKIETNTTNRPLDIKSLQGSLHVTGTEGSVISDAYSYGVISSHSYHDALQISRKNFKSSKRYQPSIRSKGHNRYKSITNSPCSGLFKFEEASENSII